MRSNLEPVRLPFFRALLGAVAALSFLVLAAPAAQAERGVPVGIYNVNNQVMNSSGYVYALRFVLDEETTVSRFISGFNLEGSDHLGGREGYADGNGGTIRARLVEVGVDGEPDLDQVLAEETVPAVQRYQESKQAFGAPGKTQLLYFNVGGVRLQAGRMYAMTYQNVDPSPAANWFSENSPTVKESVAGPNGANNLDPDAPGAIAGLDPREAVAWSRDGGKSWVWGRRAGEGNTSGAYAGSTSSDDGTRLPWYGWQTSPTATPKSNQPYYAYRASGSYTLRLRSVPEPRVLTEAGGYAPTGASAGVLTVRNLSTGETGRTAALGTGLVKGELDNPVTVLAGQSYEISNSGTVLKAEGDTFIRATFKVGSGDWPVETVGHEYDRAELFALPHPWFKLAALPVPEPAPEPEPEAPAPAPEPEPEAPASDPEPAPEPEVPAPPSAPEPEVEETEAPGPVPVSRSKDKALGQPAIASSSESSALAPRFGVDGTPETRWSSKFLDNQWWRVNLGTVRLVNRVSINWEAAYASKYQIELSRDGREYAVAATVGIRRKGRTTTRFGTTATRYVRVKALQRGTKWGVSFYDFEAYGPAD